jgi:hypothetical protein
VHHACHTEGTPHVGSRAQSCSHDHTIVVDGIVRIEHAADASSLSSLTALLPVVPARLTVAPVTPPTSPPRFDTTTQSSAASALPLRI